MIIICNEFFNNPRILSDDLQKEGRCDINILKLKINVGKKRTKKCPLHLQMNNYR